MKRILFLLLLPIWIGCCNNKQQPILSTQASEAAVATAVTQLMKGMINADENSLKSILADELVYGHSSGKVQNKSEFIAEILSGAPIKYLSITPLEQTIQMAGDVAIVRHIFTSETRSVDGEAGSLRIGNMLIWQAQNGKWKLLARQAYRL